MQRVNKRTLPEKIIYIKAGGIKDVSNATQYQRALMLSKTFELTIVTDGSVPDLIARHSEDCLRVRSGWNFVPSAIRVLRTLSKQGYRVLYSSNQPRAIIAAYLAASHLNMRWIVDLWDDPMLAFRNMRKGRVFTSLYRRFVWRSLPSSEAWILGLNKGILEALPPRDPNHRVLMVTNGTNVSATREVVSLERRIHPGDKDGLRVGYSGWVTLQRGVSLVLSYLKSVNGQEVPLEFVAWGPAEEDALEAITEHNAQQAHGLEYLGKLSHSQSLIEIAKSDVCLCLLDPSVVNFRFSYPIKLFEYMAAGKVVIATDTPAIRQVIEDGKSGILIENTVEALGEALKEVQTMIARGTIHEMEEAAKERAKAFDWKHINERIAGFLISDLGLRPKGEAVHG